MSEDDPKDGTKQVDRHSPGSDVGARYLRYFPSKGKQRTSFLPMLLPVQGLSSVPRCRSQDRARTTSGRHTDGHDRHPAPLLSRTRRGPVPTTLVVYTTRPRRRLPTTITESVPIRVGRSRPTESFRIFGDVTLIFPFSPQAAQFPTLGNRPPLLL